jgi:hypothetical protein
VKTQSVGKTSQDKAKEVANEGVYTEYITDICSLLQRSKSKLSLPGDGCGVLTRSDGSFVFSGDFLGDSSALFASWQNCPPIPLFPYSILFNFINFAELSPIQEENCLL